MKNKKESLAIIVAMLVVVAVCFGILGWSMAKNSSKKVVSNGIAKKQINSTEKKKSTTVQAEKQPVQSGDDPMSGWLTYRNDKLGFEFKYPSTLKISENFQNSNEFSGKPYLNLDIKESDDFHGAILVNSPGMGFEGYAKVSDETVMVGEVKAIISSYIESDENIKINNPQKVAMVQFDKNHNEFIMLFYLGQGNSSDGTNKLKSILSTFKFQ